MSEAKGEGAAVFRQCLPLLAEPFPDRSAGWSVCGSDPFPCSQQLICHQGKFMGRWLPAIEAPRLDEANVTGHDKRKIIFKIEGIAEAELPQGVCSHAQQILQSVDECQIPVGAKKRISDIFIIQKKLKHILR